MIAVLVFYDASDGRILHTIDGAPAARPGGAHIEIANGTDLRPLQAYRVVDGAVVEAATDAAIGPAVAQVNEMVGAARQRHITSIPGQEMIYSDKEREAREFVAVSPEPTDLTPYPWVAGEVGITGQSAYEVAQVYLNLAAAWRVVGPELETIRLDAIARIEAAATVADIRAEVSACRARIAALP